MRRRENQGAEEILDHYFQWSVFLTDGPLTKPIPTSNLGMVNVKITLTGDDGVDCFQVAFSAKRLALETGMVYSGGSSSC